MVNTLTFRCSDHPFVFWLAECWNTIVIGKQYVLAPQYLYQWFEGCRPPFRRTDDWFCSIRERDSPIPENAISDVGKSIAPKDRADSICCRTLVCHIPQRTIQSEKEIHPSVLNYLHWWTCFIPIFQVWMLTQPINNRVPSGNNQFFEFFWPREHLSESHLHFEESISPNTLWYGNNTFSSSSSEWVWWGRESTWSRWEHAIVFVKLNKHVIQRRLIRKPW